MSKFGLDLNDFEVEALVPSDTSNGFTLESLPRGHGMNEVTASAVGVCIFLCSCCCCCG
ncbi:thiomuracin/GE37468 family thiazolyl RiPP peptide [Thermopolyspora sp. NPDC052614]|uniref:thiomuracin/GE37468 family thiazolyl RiPP peptide n=1 Tax=Thermopolyspora sp. NPDC052614 TaxID=3155682 RepID=UPI003426AF0B